MLIIGWMSLEVLLVLLSSEEGTVVLPS